MLLSVAAELGLASPGKAGLGEMLEDALPLAEFKAVPVPLTVRVRATELLPAGDGERLPEEQAEALCEPIPEGKLEGEGELLNEPMSEDEGEGENEPLLLLPPLALALGERASEPEASEDAVAVPVASALVLAEGQAAALCEPVPEGKSEGEC